MSGMFVQGLAAVSLGEPPDGVPGVHVELQWEIRLVHVEAGRCNVMLEGRGGRGSGGSSFQQKGRNGTLIAPCSDCSAFLRQVDNNCV